MQHLLFLFALVLTVSMHAQVVCTDPAFPRADEPVTIIFNADFGNGGLADCNCDIYIHTGLITNESNNPSDWQHTSTVWGITDEDWKLSPVPGEENVFSFEITPSIESYYGLTPGETVAEIAMVFRNGDGTESGRATGGGDIFYPVYPDNLEFSDLLLSPESDNLLVENGGTVSIKYFTSEEATITVTDNGDEVTETMGTSLEYDLVVAGEGTHTVTIVADNGSSQLAETFTYTIPGDVTPADPPAGTRPGLTYLSDSSVRLALVAPGKEFVFAIGSFNDWSASADNQMTKSLNGELFWIDIEGLTPGELYTYQYLVDGALRIADPYSTVVLDPFNDPFIPQETYPNLPEYPEEASGIVSLFQPGAEPFDWQVDNFERPAKEELVIYELLVRDFIETQNYTTLIDTLNYLDRLGVNAIQLMPVNEFENNDSWGYNPSYHMALDKFYGPINEFKRFVDACHARGIAVILDVVYNHAFSQSPLAQLYWDEANFRPSPDNPWLNPIARHPFNVGYDFNHESQYTVDFVDQVMEYWLIEMQVDGFRFDLSKGFSQTDYGDNVGAWSGYDAARIATIKHYADVMWETSPDAYVILEHFADNAEEIELSNYGAMLWGNMNHEFNEATMGYDSNLSGTYYAARGWSNPHLVSYMESHDEERLMYKNMEFGNSSGDYDVRELDTALDRVELATTFFYSIPGPKMLWQIGELGYDFSINYCTDGTVDPDCRLAPKPVRWDYLEEEDRKDLYELTSAMIFLKTNFNAFNTTEVEHNLDNNDWKRLYLEHPEMDVLVLGNFDVVAQNIPSPFPMIGKWYEFFSGDSIQVNNPNLAMNLQPGEYRLYTTARIPDFEQVTSTFEVVKNEFSVQIFPNPTNGQFQITYKLEENARVRLDILDIYGRYVGTLANELQGPGLQQANWTEEIPAGTYLLRLSVNEKVETKRVVVID